MFRFGHEEPTSMLVETGCRSGIKAKVHRTAILRGCIALLSPYAVDLKPLALAIAA
jgi:hypothetical protein